MRNTRLEQFHVELNRSSPSDGRRKSTTANVEVAIFEEQQVIQAPGSHLDADRRLGPTVHRLRLNLLCSAAQPRSAETSMPMCSLKPYVSRKLPYNPSALTDSDSRGSRFVNCVL